MDLKVSRRKFMAMSALASAALSPSSLAVESLPDLPKGKPRIKLGLCTYSYWHFRPPKVSIETVIEKAGRLGVGGVDVLHRQMDIPEKEPLDAAGRAYLRKLKRHAFMNGVELICMSTHQNFVNPKPDEVTQNVEHTRKCIEIAYELGIPSIRINTGRWGTTDFDTLMAHRGIEPALPGFTEEDGFKWSIDAIQRCLAKAEECGVILALENHWGLARTPEGLLRILNAIQSPWLGALMDTGNFLEDPFTSIRVFTLCVPWRCAARYCFTAR